MIIKLRLLICECVIVIISIIWTSINVHVILTSRAITCTDSMTCSTSLATTWSSILIVIHWITSCIAAAISRIYWWWNSWCRGCCTRAQAATYRPSLIILSVYECLVSVSVVSIWIATWVLAILKSIGLIRRSYKIYHKKG